MYYTVEGIAKVVHEAQRALQSAQSDPVPAPEWNYAPEYMKEALIKTIRLVIQGATPEQTHELWLNDKRAEGWTYGEVKDAHARKHPCLVPYSYLPQYQKDKNNLLVAIVGVFAPDVNTEGLDKRNVVWLEDQEGRKAVAQVIFQEPNYSKRPKHKVRNETTRN
jgi:hypothetical protein